MNNKYLTIGIIVIGLSLYLKDNYLKPTNNPYEKTII